MSINHHYLPQFYLKGFVFDDRQLFYYRKNDEAIERGHEIYKRAFPSGIYYEPGLNTINLSSSEYEDVDIEKDFFMKKDCLYAKAFFDMREIYNYNIYEMPTQTKADIVEFVLGLYWRVPGRWKRLKALIKEDGLLTGDLQLSNTETNHVYSDKDIPNIINDILTIEVNQKAFMPQIYEEVIRKHNWSNIEEKFLIFETNIPLLIGDIPYIPLKSENKRNKILEEFVIPLDKNHILIYATKKPSFLEEHLFHFINLCIIDGASEKISCNALDHLKTEINDSKNWIKKYKYMGINDIKQKFLMPLLEFESTFASYEDFYEYFSTKENSRNSLFIPQ